MTNETKQEGNLTREPETRTTGTGKTVINFSIAQTPRKKNNETGEWTDGETSFFDVEFWPNDPQKWLKCLTKGTPVIVVGSLKQDRWDQDGQSRSKVKIIARDIFYKYVPEIKWQEQMKAERSSEQQQQAPSPQQQPQYPQQPVQQPTYGQQQPTYQSQDNSFPNF